MTTNAEPKSPFWVTLKIFIECSTLEIWAAEESDAYTQGEALFRQDPLPFLQSMTARTTFEADYAPLDISEG